jgi:hypothetical protein
MDPHSLLKTKDRRALGLSLRMDEVNVSAVIDDPNIVTLTWFILSRVTAPYQMQNPGIKEDKQKG